MADQDPPSALQNWSTAPEFSEIEKAAERLSGQAVRTPLLESHRLNDLVGGRVLIKPENLQRTGSFKFRGAFNRISQIPKSQRSRGVVAFSSGNHAQGVAAAAQLLEIPATIIMPADAPKIKMQNTKSYGAAVKPYDRFSESREKIAEALVGKTGATLVRPFDDSGIIAGQGTCGLEIAQQSKEFGAKLDQVLICCGGGGLSSGSAIALKSLCPEVQLFTVEPEGFDDTARSLLSGQIETVDPAARSFCDALLSPSPGNITLQILRKLGTRGLAVSDDQVRQAMRYAFQELKLVVEPGGAVCLAAVLSNKTAYSGKTTALTLSGGNVDAALFREVLSA